MLPAVGRFCLTGRMFGRRERVVDAELCDRPRLGIERAKALIQKPILGTRAS
jgi:hypothetical protein